MDVSSIETAPPRQSAAQRSREATRDRLLAAGKRLFAANGLHGVTTHDIAAAAGVASGTFYLHFADKTDLFRSIAQAAVEDLVPRLRQVLPADAPIRDGVRLRTETLISFAEENRDVMLILFGIDAEAAAVGSEVLEGLARLVQEGRSARVAAGELSPGLDPAVVSQALVGMLSRVIRWWLEDSSRAPRQTVIETLITIQLYGTHPEFPPEDPVR